MISKLSAVSTISVDDLSDVVGGDAASNAYIAQQQSKLNAACDVVGMTASKVKVGQSVSEKVYGPGGTGIGEIAEAMGPVFAKHGLPAEAAAAVKKCKGSLR
jgi:hypothetical protein